MKPTPTTILAIATLLLEQVVYIKGFSNSVNTHLQTGKLLIPHFTSSATEAFDCQSEEMAGGLIDLIIDYNGRYYKQVSLSV